MPSTIELHGARVTLLENSQAQINIGATSVIGVIGTAPDAAAAIPASAVFSTTRNYAGLVFTAVASGVAGNNISVSIGRASAVAAAPLSISVENQRDIKILLATTNPVAAAKASATTGDLTVTAVEAGTVGNDLVVELEASTEAAELAEVFGNTITIRLRNGGSTPTQIKNAIAAVPAVAALIVATSAGATKIDADVHLNLAGGVEDYLAGDILPTQTATVIRDAINLDAAASALVTASVAANVADAEVLLAALKYLSDGADEVAPLNTPFQINQSADIARFGEDGTLPAALADIYRAAGGSGATVFVVRVAENAGDNSVANVTGTLAAKTGAYAFLDSIALLGKKPQLICAPDFSHKRAVGLALEYVAEYLSGLAIVDLSAGTLAAAIIAKQGYSNALCVWPKATYYSAVVRAQVKRFASALIAGHIARVDADEGWHNSPSNRRIIGVDGMSPLVDFEISAANSTANLANQQFIATIVNQADGTFFWGNRVADGVNITEHRGRRIIGDALLMTARHWVDRNIDQDFVSFVLESMNSFLRGLEQRRQINGFKVVFDNQFNTAASIAANGVVFSFTIGFVPHAELIVFRQSVTGEFNQRVIDALGGTI